MKKNSRETIEDFFKMPFDLVITKLHWEKNLSINKISKLCNVSGPAIVRLCKLTNLRLRSHKEASSLNISKLNKSGDINRNKRALTISKTFSKKLYKQEIIFENFIKSLNLKYEIQKPIGSYNIDFFIKEKNLCIEIDSSYKWGNDRIRAAEEKDKYLKSLGYKVIRLNKVWLDDLIKFLNILL